MNDLQTVESLAVQKGVSLILDDCTTEHAFLNNRGTNGIYKLLGY